MSPRTADITPFLTKIDSRSEISRGARAALLALTGHRETYDTYRDIVREGERTDRCCLILSGLVSRYKTLRSGGRQIVSFHVAGDMVDVQSCLMMIADHGIRCHTPVEVVTFAHSDILNLVEGYPDLGRAFWFDTLVDAAILREWTLNVGRRSGVERIAHLIMELGYRLQTIGQSDGHQFVLPVTQADIADAVGISPVHVNRSLQTLRAKKLIQTKGRVMTILDEQALSALAGFDPLYMHPEGPRQLMAA
jgi:CRP-like cAMP-binding protein